MVELTDSRKDVDLYFSIHVYSIFTFWLPVQCSDISIRLVLHYLDIFNRTSPTQTVCVVNLVFGRWRLYFTSSKDRSLFYWKLFYIFWRQIFVLLKVILHLLKTDLCFTDCILHLLKTHLCFTESYFRLGLECWVRGNSKYLAGRTAVYHPQSSCQLADWVTWLDKVKTVIMW